MEGGLGHRGSRDNAVRTARYRKAEEGHKRGGAEVASKIDDGVRRRSRMVMGKGDGGGQVVGVAGAY